MSSLGVRRDEIAKMRAVAKRLDLNASKEFRHILTLALRQLDQLDALQTCADSVTPMQRGAIRAELYSLWEIRVHKKPKDRSKAAEKKLTELLRALALSPTLMRVVQTWKEPEAKAAAVLSLEQQRA